MNRSRQNRTNHFEVTFADGETFTETAKNSVGGWANMMSRVAARNGATHCTPANDEGTAWTVAGRSFTVAQVWKV